MAARTGVDRRGEFQPIGAVEPVKFTIENNQVRFTRGGKRVAFDDLMLSPEDELNLMSRILYKQVEMGYDNSGIKTAAIHVVEDSKTHESHIFVASNANHRASTQKYCAESLALGIVKTNIKVGDFKVKKTYLTLKNENDLPKGETRIPACPCGVCREELTNERYVDDDARLIAVPYFLPEETKRPNFRLKLFDQSNQPSPDVTRTPPDHAFMMRTMDLNPIYEVQINTANLDVGARWKNHMRGGVRGIIEKKEIQQLQVTNAEMMRDVMTVIGSGEGGRVPLLENKAPSGSDQGYEGYTVDRINDYLVNKIKSAYNKHEVAAKEGRVHKIKAVLVVRANGEVYEGTFVDIKGHGSKPQAEVSAITNAFNANDIKEVFVMEMDEDYIGRTLKQRQIPMVRTFYAEALEQLYKGSYRGEEVLQSINGMPISIDRDEGHTRCMLHILPLNEGNLQHDRPKFKEFCDHVMVSVPIEMINANAFLSPSSQSGVGTGRA